jgi:hypothetical protein
MCSLKLTKMKSMRRRRFRLRGRIERATPSMPSLQSKTRVGCVFRARPQAAGYRDSDALNGKRHCDEPVGCRVGDDQVHLTEFRHEFRLDQVKLARVGQQYAFD